jgi:hypothetical protein
MNLSCRNNLVCSTVLNTSAYCDKAINVFVLFNVSKNNT